MATFHFFSQLMILLNIRGKTRAERASERAERIIISSRSLFSSPMSYFITEFRYYKWAKELIKWKRSIIRLNREMMRKSTSCVCWNSSTDVFVQICVRLSGYAYTNDGRLCQRHWNALTADETHFRTFFVPLSNWCKMYNTYFVYTLHSHTVSLILIQTVNFSELSRKSNVHEFCLLMLMLVLICACVNECEWLSLSH